MMKVLGKLGGTGHLKTIAVLFVIDTLWDEQAM